MARILIVDDSALARRMMRQILEPAGHQVHEAADGYTALERYAADRPDAVVLDLTMQGLHGLEVLAKLREMDPEAAVVIASADIQRTTEAAARQRGAYAFLTKPYDADAVRSAVAGAVRRCT